MKEVTLKMLAALAVSVLTPVVSAGESVRLASSPALSPDGSALAFSWRGDVWIVPSTGGRATVLTHHPAHDDSPLFSPDGQSIAFTSDRSGSAQVWRAPVDGGESIQLTAHTEGLTLEDWFPDGDSILVGATRDHFWRRAHRFFRIRSDRRGAEELLFDAYGKNGSLSPDGGRLLFTREGRPWWRKGYRGSASSQIWLRELDRDGFTELVREETGARWPLWRPDGRAFYHVSARSGSFNLWEREVGAAEPRQLTFFDDDSVVFPAISRDGSVIVFRHLFDLYRLDPGNSEPPRRLEIHSDSDSGLPRRERRKLTSATDVSFTGDGLEIAFTAAGDVWVMDSELREPRRVTNTPEEERDVEFAPDGTSLWFSSDAGGQTDLWRARRGDGSLYWWQNESFELSRMTDDSATERELSWSPDGSRLAFVRGGGDLWTISKSGEEQVRVLQTWSEPEFDWSPDSRWFVYAHSDNDFNSDVWIMPSDGSASPRNVSRHPDDDSRPVWSPDGKIIAFTARRVDRDVDIFFVYLREEDDQKGSRARKLEKALEKMKKARKEKGKKNGKTDETTTPPAKEPVESKAVPAVEIDFEDIHRRIRRIRIPESSPRGLFFSPDSKKIAFQATVNGRVGTYTVEPAEDLTPKLLSPSIGTKSRWLSEGDRIVRLVGGVPGTLSSSGKTESFSFSVRTEVDLATKHRVAFDQAWQTMRQSYYDERLGNRNWDAVRRKYSDMAAACVDRRAFESVVQLMLGELNGSHLGFRASSPGAKSADEWKDTTVHLGLRFDPAHRGPGLRVRDVVPGGPADRESIRVRAGEVVLGIDGTNVDPAMDLTSVLNGDVARTVRLEVRGADHNTRRVEIRPATYGAVRGLLYEKWLADSRQRVSELSAGEFGYVHIRGMNWPSFLRFEEEIYAVGAGKSGLVIDVRENGGGFTTDHLLTILTQPKHATTVARGGGPGYPQGRRVYAAWNKPIVVLCNQNSFSNAEIFSHAIKTLGRGQLVGVPTAGGVISTGGRRILDIGFLRIPMRGWYLVGDGQDMELNGAVPHHVLWHSPGEIPAGTDRQLEKAVDVLRLDVESWKKRGTPARQKASERSGFGLRRRRF